MRTDPCQLHSLSAGFLWKARRTLFPAGVIAFVIGSWVASWRLQKGAETDAAFEASALSAAATGWKHPGGFAVHAARLASEWDRVVAVVARDAAREIVWLYPDTPDLREFAKDLPEPNESIVGTRTVGTHSYRVAVATELADGVGLPTRASPSSTKHEGLHSVSVVIRPQTVSMSFLFLGGLFGVMVAGAHWIGVRQLANWFGDRVQNPLDRLITALRSKGEVAIQLQDWLDAQTGRGIGVAKEFLTIRTEIVERESQSRRVERDARQQLRDHELGLSRKLRRAEDRAQTDVLTGLKNRSFLNTELQGIVDRQRAGGLDIAVVMIDVDNFKPLNDTMGHSAGDELLRFIGQLLRGSIRPSDHAIRYGGDEFVLVLVGANQEQARNIVERTVKMFGQYASTNAGTRNVSLSAGISTLQSNPRQIANELVTSADAALYIAKRGGKRMVAVKS